MTRAAPHAASRAADGAAQPSDGRLIALFLDMLAAERGAAPNTLAAYRRDLADFASYLADAGATVKSATTEDVRRYLGALARRGLRPASVARRLSAIRQLYRFLYAERQRKDDPAAVLEGPKRTRPLPKTLSLAEVDRLLGFAARRDPAAALSERVRAARLACLVELLYATGLRVSELVALPIAAARRDARVVVVRGKGNKERLVPLNDAAKRAMAEYLALRAEAEGRRRRRGGTIEMAVPLIRRQRPSHPSALRPRAQGAGGCRRTASGAGESARAAPRLRQPPPAQRRRPARGADAAWARRHFHHPDLHPRPRRAPEKPGARSAPLGG